MAKAWYLYNGGPVNLSSSYTLYDLNAIPPCPDGCVLCAIKSTTGVGPRPINPLSNNVLAYLTNFQIAQRVQPLPNDPYVVGKGTCS